MSHNTSTGGIRLLDRYSVEFGSEVFWYVYWTAKGGKGYLRGKLVEAMKAAGPAGDYCAAPSEAGAQLMLTRQPPKTIRDIMVAFRFARLAELDAKNQKE